MASERQSFRVNHSPTDNEDDDTDYYKIAQILSQQKKDEMEMSSKRIAVIETTEQRLKEMQEKHEKLQEKYEKMQKRNVKLKTDRDNLKHAEKNYSALLKDMEIDEKEYEAEIKSLKKQLRCRQSELQAALEDKTRSSDGIESKLHDIETTDISDPERTSKLAERYNELFDNQWTDALEGLLNVYSEEKAIKQLLNVFKDCYTFCAKLGKQQLDSLQALLQNPSSSITQQAWSPLTDVPTERSFKTMTKMLKESRKHILEVAVKNVTKCYMQEYRSILKRVNEAFVQRCVELCWMMNMQDPPVEIGEECAVGSTFDGNNFREYTNSGTEVAFTVWLPLYLHKDGPLLCKGVAQTVKKTGSPISTKSRDVVEYDPHGNRVHYSVVMRSGIEYAVYCDKHYALDGFRRALNLSKTSRK